MENEEAQLTIYTFRDDLTENLQELQRSFFRAEEVIEQLVKSSQKLTIERQCSLQEPVFEGKETTHFTTQRHLLLLQDRIAVITALFVYGKLAILKEEAATYHYF